MMETSLLKGDIEELPEERTVLEETETRRSLQELHTWSAIAKRIGTPAPHSYLGDFVLGAIDGAVTTFAVVAGAAGAGLSAKVALILGTANGGSLPGAPVLQAV